MLITKATLCTLLLVGVSLAADPISTPTANARNKEETKAPTSCGAGMFQCPSSGRCIPQGWKCDMESDCEQGEDEKDCVQAAQQCSDTKEYKCEEADRVVSSGTMDQGLRLGLNLGFIHHCIPKEWRCDGEADCVNKDDEKGCETIKCDPSTHFECQSYDSNTTQCIPLDWKCDGQTDCLDMKDEEGCTYNPNKNNCDSSEFRCADGQCIYSNWKCDGDRDCNDGSDEVNCEKTTCDGTNKFNCKSGFCIPSSWRCDGEIDCADHSDELDCAQTHANHTIKCTDKEFTCANNAQCISKFWVCDGDADCFDESDEKDCQDKKVAKECEKGQKACKNNFECVDEAMWCNGTPECSDSSDEADCQEIKSRKDAQCNNDTEYQCPNAASQCIPYESLCKDGLAKNDCLPSVCNKNVFMCKEGEPDCVCRSTGTTGKACYCPTGYKYNGNECKDINECEEAGTCDQLCFNTKGSYRCDCYPGYKLTHPMKNESTTKCRAVGADPLLLLSNRAAIRQYDLHTNKYHPLITKLESAVAMDYWHANQTLIWSDVSKEQISICHIGKNFTDATILGSLNDCLEKGNVTLIDKDVATPDGLAIDWVHGLLFWTDTGRDEINVMDLNTKRRKILFNKDLDEPRAIAVDPSLGLIFWTDWGEKARIERAGMNGEDRVAIIDKSIHVSWPNGLALDILDRRVYWADAKTKAISSSDYNGHHQRTVLRSNRHVKHPFSLAVFEERLYFTDWDQEGVLTVNKFKGNDVKMLMRGVSGPMTVRIYHPQAQPNHTDKCFNHDCHHLCLPRAHLNAGNEERGLIAAGRPYSCACMDGFEFSIDNHSLCISGVFGAAAPTAEDASSSSGLSLTYFLLLLVVALAFILGVMYRRHRPSQFTVLHFDNPVYRRTVEDLEADITDNSLGAISILPINPRGNESGGIGGQMDGKLVINPSVLKSKEETKKLNTNSSYVDVHDPDSYAYDQPLHPSQKT